MEAERTVVCRACGSSFVSRGPNTQWCSRECAFIQQVRVGEGCHEWVGKNVNGSGYGMLSFRSKIVLAHRFAYERAIGPIPRGMLVCHRCDNRLCCNAAHLFIGTAKDNHLDMVSKGRAEACRPPVRAKLTEQEVITARDSPEGARAIAKRFGVGRTAIQKIRKRQTWSHV